MAGSPSIEPVLTAEFGLGLPLRVGTVGCGEFMTLVSLTGGKIKSVEGGILSGLVDADFVNGLDISRVGQAQTLTRLKVESVWKNKDDSILHLTYDAIVRMTEEAKRIFFNHPEKKSTAFGDVYASMTFHTGNPKLKALEESIFVGSGRFLVEDGKDLRIEYKIGRIVG